MLHVFISVTLPIDMPSTSVHAEDFAEADSLQYVVGSFFKRLGCDECAQKLCRKVDCQSASGLTAARLYEGSHLMEPAIALSLEVGSNMANVMAFLDANYHLRDICKKASAAYPLSHRLFCSAVHEERFTVLYVQFMCRVYCKRFNQRLRDKSRKVKRKMRKL